MSNEKKVWVGTLDKSNPKRVKLYDMSPNYPNVLPFLEYQRIEDECVKNPNDEVLHKRSHEYLIIAAEISKAYRSFKKLESLPDSLWIEKSARRHRKLPKNNDDIFTTINGYTIFNESTANLFKQFRLGETTLSPVKIFSEVSPDQPLTDNIYYFLNLCEHRHFITEKQSNEKMKYRDKNRLTPYYLASTLKNDMVEIKKSALECDLDFWHDPLYMGCYFFSDSLYQSLVKANLDKNWKMFSCKLVE